MEKQRSKAKLLLVGSDARLAYLLGRYAEQTEMEVVKVESYPTIFEITRIKPTAIIFSSIDIMRESGSIILDLIELDIQMVVCASIGDELAARELGADVCMFHPISFEMFCDALALNCAR